MKRDGVHQTKDEEEELIETERIINEEFKYKKRNGTKN